MNSFKMLMVVALTIFSVSAFAQDTTKPKTEKVQYTCPMHPEVMMDKFGKCPKCDKDLVISTKEQMKMDVMKIYMCPAHLGEKSDKPGKCPICGKKLNMTPKEQMKMQEMGLFTCPMHPDVTSDKSGK